MPSPTTSGATNHNVPASLNPNVNALLAGVKWNAGPAGTGAALTYSFPWINDAPATFAGYNGAPYSDLGENTAATRDGLNLEQQAAARDALARWSAVANLTFQQVADTAANVGDLRFAWTSASAGGDVGAGVVWGWATYPNAWWPAAGDVWISTLGSGTDPDQGWSAGSGNFSSLLHEIGHAVGLKHPFEGSNRLPAALDSSQYSVMSYTEGPNSLFLRVTQEGSSIRWESFNVQPDTPMLLDIAAAQYLYGANMSHATGNDVYTFDPSVPFMRTIWDAGGSDTISIANFTRGSSIDLRAGSFSSISIPSDSAAGWNWQRPPPEPTYDGTNNLAIAYGVVIENAIGGSGHDSIVGNDAANRLQGGGGGDTLHGGAGLDTAVYTGNRSGFSVSTFGTGFIVSDRSGSEGVDTLTGIERIRFGDGALALDLGGNAGAVARTLGAVFGKDAVRDPNYVAAGLNYADQGVTAQQLMQVAIEVRLQAAASSHVAVVDLLYTNLAGSAPSAAQAQPFLDMLQSGASTVASLGVRASETELNLANIGFAGLVSTGLPYLPA
ncbi:MAG TPA: M10 family metallopeptidase [Ramlibacter sp.]